MPAGFIFLGQQENKRENPPTILKQGTWNIRGNGSVDEKETVYGLSMALQSLTYSKTTHAPSWYMSENDMKSAYIEYFFFNFDYLSCNFVMTPWQSLEFIQTSKGKAAVGAAIVSAYSSISLPAACIRWTSDDDGLGPMTVGPNTASTWLSGIATQLPSPSPAASYFWSTCL